MRTKTLLTTAMMMLAGTTLLAVAPTVSAHDCDSILGPVGCGYCTDNNHDGSHNITYGRYSVPYCSSSPTDLLDLGDDGGLPEGDPACAALTATGLGNCDS